MEVLKNGDIQNLVTNIEVVNILSGKIIERNVKKNNCMLDVTNENIGLRPKRDKFHHRDFIEQRVFDYLSNSPCMELDQIRSSSLISILRCKPSKKLEINKNINDDRSSTSDSNDQNGNTTQNSSNNEVNGINRIKNGFGLMDAEVLQILNHMPREPVELHLIIQDLLQRLNEDRQSEILKLISQYIGPRT